MSAEDNRLDQELAAFSGRLAEVRAPDRLRRHVMASIQARQRRWPFALAAALAGLAAALVLLQPDTADPGVRAPEFVVVRQHVPIRTFTVAQGPTTRMVDASIVKDRHGLTRAVYVHRTH